VHNLRLTLAGINSFGTTIGAILLTGNRIIRMEMIKTDLSLEDIKLAFYNFRSLYCIIL
jgi:hypothetical protein